MKNQLNSQNILTIKKSYLGFIISSKQTWLGLGIFVFTTVSRMALEPTQPPIQWVPGALSLGVKQLGREADHSPSSSTKVKE
jgi:hypothetical protein